MNSAKSGRTPHGSDFDIQIPHTNRHPAFFKSDSYRDELRQFIEYEKSLGRDDLILPIYFVTAPVLERPELLKNDTLASEIGSRQRYDWRLQADLPPKNPQIRRAIRDLAEKIAMATERTSGPTPAPAAAGAETMLPPRLSD